MWIKMNNQTRKRGNCECIVTWGRPSQASLFGFRPNNSLKSLNQIHCRIITFLLLYITLCCDLDLWIWTFAVYRLWRVEPLYQIWTQSSYPAELLRFSYLIWWPWTYVTCCDRLGSEIIFTTFYLRQLYPCLNYSVSVLIRYVTLWPWPLTRWPYKFVVLHQVLRNQSLYEIWAKLSNSRHNFSNFCTRYVTLWPWPLTSWLWTFTALRVSCV